MGRGAGEKRKGRKSCDLSARGAAAVRDKKESLSDSDFYSESEKSESERLSFLSLAPHRNVRGKQGYEE